MLFDKAFVMHTVVISISTTYNYMYKVEKIKLSKTFRIHKIMAFTSKHNRGRLNQTYILKYKMLT